MLNSSMFVNLTPNVTICACRILPSPKSPEIVMHSVLSVSSPIFFNLCVSFSFSWSVLSVYVTPPNLCMYKKYVDFFLVNVGKWLAELNHINYSFVLIQVFGDHGFFVWTALLLFYAAVQLSIFVDLCVFSVCAAKLWSQSSNHWSILILLIIIKFGSLYLSPEVHA